MKGGGNMNMQRVSSSNILAIGYDSNSSTLRVKFHKGGCYDYFNVPFSVYNSLMKASSHGGYHADFIKGFYGYKLVR